MDYQFFFIYMLKDLLAQQKTSAYYAINPFIAAIFSLIIFLEIPSIQYLFAFIVMIIGAYLASSDAPLFKKKVKKDDDI